MIDGVDYAWERPSPTELAAAGYRFACRYLSWDTSGKNLSDTERRALHAAGLDVVLNWEYQPHAALGGYGQGTADATEALRQARALGAPDSAAIYFSVDFDAQSDQLLAVEQYVQGCCMVLGRERVGTYGGIRVINALVRAGLGSWYWQTYAWSAGAWNPAAHIRQVRNGVTVAGANVDLDSATVTEFGQWHAAPVAPPSLIWTEQLIMNLPTVSRGATGPAVRRVQGLLWANGYTLSIDGDFGPITDRTVRVFQSAHGLLVDGVVGEHTWTALLTV